MALRWAASRAGVVRGNEVLYEVQWKGCEDPKQNTFENLQKLKKLDMVGLAKVHEAASIYHYTYIMI